MYTILLAVEFFKKFSAEALTNRIVFVTIKQSNSESVEFLTRFCALSFLLFFVVFKQLFSDKDSTISGFRRISWNNQKKVNF